ncbi:hypothetical protein [Mucilaginibacter aquaedulcis]|uniref:hypothetical protein n=1 Tax=Mucilaginibacter aquaedulcis TaxID=1187081 RepID=UPI0025B4505E|nr:hypothetical protein [Mucilaginibacter aquaedulcis]MDN3548905.1 hypothetical protein [Mucilaginibacter aquaedulcis]
MKLSCFLFLIALLNTVFCSFRATGQTFDANGHYVPPNSNDELYVANTVVKFNPGTLDEAGYEVIKKQLLERINAAIAYIDHDQKTVTAIYSQLFGKDFASRFYSELRHMQAYLNDGIKTPFVYPDLFDYEQLEAMKRHPLFVEPIAGPLSPDLLSFNLPKNDLLTQFILGRYRNSLKSDPVASRKMDANYLAEWQKIENNFDQLKKLESDIIKFKTNKYKLTNEDIVCVKNRQEAIKLEECALVGAIGQSRFLQQWLWYSGGVPVINPLGTTPADRRYPGTETNTFYTADLRKKQDELNGTNALENFATTKIIYNSLGLLIINSKDKHNYKLAEYDAAENEPGNGNYYKILSDAPEQLKNNLGLKLAIYNVPADQTITPVPGHEDLAYQSKGSLILGGVFNQWLSLQTLISTNLATFGALQPLLNPSEATPVPIRFSSSGQAEWLDNGKSQHAQKPPGALIEGIPIGTQFIPLTGKDQDEDKRRLIIAWYVSEGWDTHNKNFLAQMEGFIKWDHNRNFLHYDSGLHEFKIEVQHLTDNFKAYIEEIKRKVELLNAQLKLVQEKLIATEAYVRITNRSLPPEKFEEKIGKSPVLVTFTYNFKLPSAPVTLTYTITATGQEKGATPKEVASGRSNVIETQRFDFSVGLAYTFPTYYVTHDGTLPTTDLGDHFQFTAGAHIYPFGELNKLGKGLGPFNERFSTYFGLSLSHPLDNYFAGFSYDITPGIRPTIGWHWYKNVRYKVLNNSIVDKVSGINAAGFFISVNFEPAILIKRATAKN